MQTNIALITGGASGIGLALAKQCLLKKLRVVIFDKNLAALYQAQKNLSGQVDIFQVDLSQEQEVIAAAEKVVNTIGTPDYLFNNAGIGGISKPVWEQELSEVKNVFEVNFFSTLILTQFFLPKMLENNIKGTIVNTASMASYYSAPLISNYVASKHAVLAYSECLYHDLKLTNANIQVAVVCPGGVKTHILDHETNKNLESFNREQQHFLIKFAKLIKKGIEPDQIAELIFSALGKKQFYIFTHPEMLKIVEQRLQNALEIKQPQPLNFE